MDDERIKSLGDRLSQMVMSHKSRQEDHKTLLDDHSSLLEAFKAIKTTLEENEAEKARIEKRAEQSSYALVLVDGNAYTFIDELISDKEGGSGAAWLLADVVAQYLQEINVSVSRVCVRIYADLTTLSKNLGERDLVFAPFAAQFNRSMNYFDFVDTLDEEGTMSKIGALFRIAAEDKACTHIIYAACHDTRYLSSLDPYAGLKSKISLVQGPGFKSEFLTANLLITQFPTIFRSDKLPSPSSSNGTAANAFNRTDNSPHKAQKQSAMANLTWRRNAPGGDQADRAPPPAPQTMPICTFYAKGFCGRGDSCKFLHETHDDNPQDSKKTDRPKFWSVLPPKAPPGCVYLNKDGLRIDPYLRYPSPPEWQEYFDHCAVKKPCNYHHIRDACMTPHCKYDHGEVGPRTRYVLEHKLKVLKCPAESACRDPDCFFGHHCQNIKCTGNCKMTPRLHNIDLVVATTIQGQVSPMRSTTGQSNGNGNGINKAECEKCNKTGHLSKDCLAETHCGNCGSVDHNDEQCDQRRKAATIKCRHCNKMGHFSMDCLATKAPDCKFCGKAHPTRLCRNVTGGGTDGGGAI